MINKEKFRAEYYKYFEEKIIPQIQAMEKYRKKTVIKVIGISLTFLLLGIIFSYIFILLMLKLEYNFILWPLILFLMYACLIQSIVTVIITSREYLLKLQDEVLPLFFPVVANFKNWPKNFSIATILDSELFPNFDTQEDIRSFFGFYNKTNIIISDTKLTLPFKIQNKPNLFRGITIQLELEKSFNNHVILISKNEHKYNRYRQAKPPISELNQFLYTFAKNPENIDFINQEFWEAIKELGTVFTAKGFNMSINDNIILIALRSKKPLQFGFLFKSLVKAKNYDDLINKFIVIYNLVNVLNKS